MFLHLCVILFTGEGVYDVTSCVVAWSHVLCRGYGTPLVLTLVAATKAGGMHPTGIHSCYINVTGVSGES